MGEFCRHQWQYSREPSLFVCLLMAVRLLLVTNCGRSQLPIKAVCCQIYHDDHCETASYVTSRGSRFGFDTVSLPYQHTQTRSFHIDTRLLSWIHIPIS